MVRQPIYIFLPLSSFSFFRLGSLERVIQDSYLEFKGSSVSYSISLSLSLSFKESQPTFPSSPLFQSTTQHSLTFIMTSASTLLEALYKAPSSVECSLAAEQLSNYVNQKGLRSLQEEKILDSLLKATRNKKSGYEREAGAVGLESIFTKVGGKNSPSPLGAEPWLLETLPALLELYADKGDVVKEAAISAVNALFGLAPPESTPVLLELIYGVLGDTSAKWQGKVGALKLLGRLSEAASEQVAEQLVELIPHLTSAMHETKSEVSSRGSEVNGIDRREQEQQQGSRSRKKISHHTFSPSLSLPHFLRL